MPNTESNFEEILDIITKSNLKDKDRNKVEELLEKDKNVVTEKDSNGMTLLHHAVIQEEDPLAQSAETDNFRRSGIAILLIKNGANVNAIDDNNRTPLLNAAIKGNSVMIYTLIENGANVNAIDVENKTPLDYANENDKPNKLIRLLGKGAKLGTELLNTNIVLATPANDNNDNDNVIKATYTLPTSGGYKKKSKKNKKTKKSKKSKHTRRKKSKRKRKRKKRKKTTRRRRK